MTGIGLAAYWRRRSKMKKKADQVAVMTARMPCMFLMPTDGCAHAMALRTVGSIHTSISSLSWVHAACTLTGGGVTPKRCVRLPVVQRRVWNLVDVSGNSVNLSLAGRIGGVVVVVPVVGLGEDVKAKVEAEEVASSSVPSMKVLLNFLDLSLKRLRR
eukprot:1751423-Pleurochrysis_carterae.AAC.1